MEKKKQNKKKNFAIWAEPTQAGIQASQKFALGDLHEKTKPRSAPWTGSTQWLWVKQGYAERQLSDSVAVHRLRSFRDCAYGRDNR